MIKSIAHIARLAVVVIVFITTNRAMGQTYPVQVSTQLIAPYTTELDYYANPAYNRFTTSIFVADPSANNYPVKLRLVIKGRNGIQIQTKAGAEFGPIFLNGGVTEFYSGFELAQLFDVNNLDFAGMTLANYIRNGGLPEGVYQFHVEVLDNNLNVVVSNSNAGFHNAWLVRNRPPILNRPRNDKTIIPMMPQNIMFHWSPRHNGSPNAGFNVEYHFKIVEIYPHNRNPYDAINTSIPIFETITTATSLNYGIAEPYLEDGKRYAWQVQVMTTDNLDLFKNNGLSEVFSFYYGKPCPVPKNFAVGYFNKVMHSRWETILDHQSYDIRYRKQESNTWNYGTTTTYYYNYPTLEPSSTYVFQIQGFCEDNVSPWSDEYLRKTMAEETTLTCVAPKNYLVKINEENTQISWEPIAGNTGYILEVRPVARYAPYAAARVTDNSYSLSHYFVSKSDKKKGMKRQTRNGGVVNSNPSKVVDPNFNAKMLLGYETWNVRVTAICADGSKQVGPTMTVDRNMKIIMSGECAAPSVVGFNITGLAPDINVNWKSDFSHKAFKFYYREQGQSDWIVLNSESPTVQLSNIKIDQKYDYKIGYICHDDIEVITQPNIFLVPYSLNGTVNSKTGSCFAPVNIAHLIDKEEKTVQFIWDKEKDVRGYNFKYRKVGGEWTDVDLGKNTYTLRDLSENVTYEYQVACRCSDNNLSEYSDIATFNTSDDNTYSGKCDKVLGDSAKAVRSDIIKVNWSSQPEHSGYIIEYRPIDTRTWYQKNTTDSSIFINGLTAKTTYEYQITAQCGIGQSKETDEKEVTTPGEDEDTEFACGLPSDNYNLNNKTPIDALAKGDTIFAADFDIKIDSVYGNGPYSGSGKMILPYMNRVWVNVILEDVKINTDSRMFAGRVIVKGIHYQLLDQNTVDKINNLINQVNTTLDKTDQLLTTANQLQTELNKFIDQLKEPIIDTGIYASMTPQQLFEEGKRIFNEAQAMIKDGIPSDPVEFMQKLNLATALIKKAISLGYEVGHRLSNLMKYIKEKIEEKRHIKAQDLHNKLEEFKTDKQEITKAPETGAYQTFWARKSNVIYLDFDKNTEEIQRLAESEFDIQSTMSSDLEEVYDLSYEIAFQNSVLEEGQLKILSNSVMDDLTTTSSLSENQISDGVEQRNQSVLILINESLEKILSDTKNDSSDK